MKKVLKPAWSKEQGEAGLRSFKSWDQFFAARGKSEEGGASTPLTGADAARLAAARAQHEASLLGYPNVVGVAEGIRTRRGKPTGESCLTVYVTHKVPARELAAADRLPRSIGGILIDVVAVGPIEAQAV